MQQETFDAAMAGIGSKATYAGATTSTVGWFLSSEFGVLCGVVVGLFGLGINLYYKRKADKRHQAEHEARMREMER